MNPTPSTSAGPAPTDRPTSTELGEEAVLTRSEEQLVIGTENVTAGKARLRKRIVTEDVTVTVPVSREEVVLERSSLPEAEQEAVAGAELTEHTWELVLYAERVVVTKEIVPVERVRMSTQVVTEEQDVTDTVRRERIEVAQTEGVRRSDREA